MIYDFIDFYPPEEGDDVNVCRLSIKVGVIEEYILRQNKDISLGTRLNIPISPEEAAMLAGDLEGMMDVFCTGIMLPSHVAPVFVKIGDIVKGPVYLN